MAYGARVKLTDNLTRYHPSLVVGSEGVTVPPCGMYCRGSDRFVSVRFDKTTIDVLWSGLKIIDEAVLARIRTEEEALERSIKKTAKNAVKTVGPRGGFKNLSFEYVHEDHPGTGVHHGTGSKDDAEKYERWLSEAGVRIKVETERPSEQPAWMRGF